jgi:hypothetical protein
MSLYRGLSLYARFDAVHQRLARRSPTTGAQRFCGGAAKIYRAGLEHFFYTLGTAAEAKFYKSPQPVTVRSREPLGTSRQLLPSPPFRHGATPPCAAVAELRVVTPQDALTRLIKPDLHARMNVSAIRAGHIYLLQNPAFTPDTLKGGKTSRCVYARARELSRQTAIPEPFIVAYKDAVWDIAQAEDRLFSRLDRYRRYHTKEYFRLPLAAAIAVAEEVVAEVNAQQRETLAHRRQSVRDFERKMSERDEAERLYYRLKEEFEDDETWLHAPDPPEEAS